MGYIHTHAHTDTHRKTARTGRYAHRILYHLSQVLLRLDRLRRLRLPRQRLEMIANKRGAQLAYPTSFKLAATLTIFFVRGNPPRPFPPFTPPQTAARGGHNNRRRHRRRRYATSFIAPASWSLTQEFRQKNVHYADDHENGGHASSKHLLP